MVVVAKFFKSTALPVNLVLTVRIFFELSKLRPAGRVSVSAEKVCVEDLPELSTIVIFLPTPFLTVREPSSILKITSLPLIELLAILALASLILSLAV